MKVEIIRSVIQLGLKSVVVIYDEILSPGNSFRYLAY